MASPFRTIASAQLYFHLFYARHTPPTHPPMDIALTALLVASKGEETGKKIRHLLAAAFLTLHPTFTGTTVDVKIVEEHRLRITQYEHLVLEAIGYNFATRHAHQVLAALSRTLHLSSGSAVEAFEFCRQAYMTVLVLCYPPEFIAVAAVIWMRRRQRRKLHKSEMAPLRRLTDGRLEQVEKIIEFVENHNNKSSI